MRKPCYLGLDVGLTRIKVAAFDSAGEQVAITARAMPRSVLSASLHEIDSAALEGDVHLVLREIAGLVAARGYEAAGLGVTGHGNGLYLVDEQLRPVGRGIASSDRRAQRYLDAIAVDVREQLHAATGSRPWVAQPAPLLRWHYDACPQVFERTRWALSCKDWVVCSLTGVVSADYSDASAGGIVELARREYSRLPFAALGLPAEAIKLFPPLRPSGEIVGTVTPGVAAFAGLPPGLPVIAGCMDCVAAALGTGAKGPGDVTVIAGTWAINAVVGSVSGPPPEVTLSALLPDPSLMLCMEVSPASASNLDWFASALGPRAGRISVEALIQEAAEVPPGADGLVFLPFVNGSGGTSPASGTLLGVSAFHTRGHLVRAVLEGVAQSHRVQLGRVVDTGLVAVDRPWQLAGGGAKSRFWAQIFADVTQRTLHPNQDRELGALGVAALVADTVGDGSAGWFGHTATDVVEPGLDSAFYGQQAAIFDSLMHELEPAWATLAATPVGADAAECPGVGLPNSLERTDQ